MKFSPVTGTTPFETIFSRHGSDKARYHSYHGVYHQLFEHRRDTVESVLEIGVLEGASMRAWEEYFPKAQIYGLDCNLKDFSHSDRIHLFDVDTRDAKSFLELCASFPKFDLIVDDGGHAFTEQFWALSVLRTHLEPGGFYVIEDVQEERFLQCFSMLQNVQLLDLRANVPKYDDLLVVLSPDNHPQNTPTRLSVASIPF